jgi:acyl carrier protein
VRLLVFFDHGEQMMLIVCIPDASELPDVDRSARQPALDRRRIVQRSQRHVHGERRLRRASTAAELNGGQQLLASRLRLMSAPAPHAYLRRQLTHFPAMRRRAARGRGVATRQCRLERVMSLQMFNPGMMKTRRSLLSLAGRMIHFAPSGKPLKHACGFVVSSMSATLSSGELELAELIVAALNLEGVSASDIDPEAPLFKTGLGLDSIDALELALEISKRYGFQLRSDDENNVRIFSSLRSLAAHIAQNRVT